VGVFAAHARAQATGFANVNGTNLYYETAGNGPNVVFIHCGLADSRVWNDQFKEFAKHFRVVRYDLRGFGRSDFPSTAFSHVDDLYALLQLLNIKKTSLIGLSLGGSVAADFTIGHPEIVDKLVLTSSGLRGDPLARNPSSTAVYKAAEEKGMDSAIALWGRHPFFAAGMKKQAFRDRMRQMLTDNYRYWGPTPKPIQVIWPQDPTINKLDVIGVPTLIVTGGEDAENIRQIGDKLRSLIAGSKGVVIPKAGHHLNMERPREYNKAVIDFLSVPRAAKEEFYGVYEAVLNQMFSGKQVTFDTRSKIDRLLIRNEINTTYAAFGNEENWKQVRYRLPHLSDETIRNYEAVVKVPSKLRQSFDLDLRYALFSDDEYGSIFDAGDDLDRIADNWSKFYTRYPASGGYVQLSNVGFDNTRRQALVYFIHRCGFLCGTGHYILLSKQGDVWSVDQIAMMWTS